jgi:protein-L-isoaspartate(D-aspartate) O-methyltransferase
MIDYAQARLNMVEGQLRTNKVTDEAVLDAFLAVPRELYVPSSLRGAAYVDDDIPLGGGRSMMEPLVLARLLQLASITPRDEVLEIGCGTGYATALIARLAGAVTALECDARLAAAARRLLAQQGVRARVVEGELAAGWPEGAPYNVIVFNGAAAAIPEAIAAQLAEGGRLVGVVRPDAGPAGRANGEAVLMTKAEGALSSRPVFDAAVHELPGCGRAPSFVF